MKTKGEIEAEISEAMVRFEIDYMGRGPKEARSHITEDMVLVRLKGVLTPAEQQLAKSKDGVELIKRMRSTLIENAKAHLSQVIADITGVQILGLHTDISTASGERVMVFTLNRDLEKTLPRKKTSDLPKRLLYARNHCRQHGVTPLLVLLESLRMVPHSFHPDTNSYTSPVNEAVLTSHGLSYKHLFNVSSAKS